MTTPLPISQIQTPLGVIDLGLGNPSFSLLPLDLMRAAAETRFAEADSSFLQYGIEQGDAYFRLALAGFLSRGYGFLTKPDDLFITSSISN